MIDLEVILVIIATGLITAMFNTLMTIYGFGKWKGTIDTDIKNIKENVSLLNERLGKIEAKMMERSK